MQNHHDKAPKLLKWLTLFASSGTLICCALPIILVTVGLGASVATFTNALPFLVYLSIHKVWVFVFSGAMLMITAWVMYHTNQTCPSTQALAKICQQTKSWNKRVFYLSITIWVIGFFAAFLALPLRMALE